MFLIFARTIASPNLNSDFTETAEPSDMSTVFITSFKVVRISEELGQHHILVTADLAIYSKAQRIMWSRPEPLGAK